MFCYQCEQTNSGTGCVLQGNCGKDPLVAALQDALVVIAKEVAVAATARPKLPSDATAYVIDALFLTVTNVNFDPPRFLEAAKTGVALRDGLGGHGLAWDLSSVEALADHASDLAITERLKDLGPDVTGLQELALYGVKGAAAYLHHANVLGKYDAAVTGDLVKALAALHPAPADIEVLAGMALGVGEINLRVMAMLDAGHVDTFGHPEPTALRITPVAGKCILVSGHDLLDLKALLEQTEGTGIQVYTHGEMLPAHGYPELKRHAHLAGNFGGAWQNQQREFCDFPGPILMTTNCIQRPAAEYADRIYTCGLVGWPGVKHIEGRDFSEVIEAAKQAPGFAETEPEQTILTGFARNAILQHAGTVLDAVKAGALKRIFLIGGCDGAVRGRNYYTRLAEMVPQDCVILTLGCGKFRFNKAEFGTLGGLPRLMDVGQCNDAYSAIVVAGELAKAVGCGVNDLPLSLVLSWYEQKAVAILLTLLHLGVKDIRVGPTLPAFLSPAVVGVLNQRFGLLPTLSPETDLAACLA